jgi:hypothetical protein
MPWKERTVFEQRKEFVMLANHEGSNISQLCERYGISRKTCYKWLGRANGEGWTTVTYLLAQVLPMCPVYTKRGKAGMGLYFRHIRHFQTPSQTKRRCGFPLKTRGNDEWGRFFTMFSPGVSASTFQDRCSDTDVPTPTTFPHMTLPPSTVIPAYQGDPEKFGYSIFTSKDK